MSDVTRHYASQGIVERILGAIPGARDGTIPLSAPHLFPFDQLHGRELQATKDHGERLAPRRGQRVLDIGSGIGGPARFLATTYGCRVTGIDLTPEFVDASNELSRLCGLSDQVNFEQADASRLPFDANSVDGAICFYVGMNLRDKAGAVAEAFRVLKPGGRIVWTEATLNGRGRPVYPLPWAKDESTSDLVEPAELQDLFRNAGFTLEDAIDESAAHVELARQRAASGVGPTPEQLQVNEVVLGQGFVERRRNYIDNLREGRLASHLIVARKP